MVRKLGEEVELEPEEVEAYLSDISDGDDKEPDGWWFQEQGFVHPKGEKAIGVNHAMKVTLRYIVTQKGPPQISN